MAPRGKKGEWISSNHTLYFVFLTFHVIWSPLLILVTSLCVLIVLLRYNITDCYLLLDLIIFMLFIHHFIKCLHFHWTWFLSSYSYMKWIDRFTVSVPTLLNPYSVLCLTNVCACVCACMSMTNDRGILSPLPPPHDLILYVLIFCTMTTFIR